MATEIKEANNPLEPELADKVFDIKAKLLMAEHVVAACAAEFEKGPNNLPKNLQKQIEYYTGIKNVDVNTEKKTIRGFLAEKLAREDILSMCSVVHQALVTFYVTNEIIPKKIDMVKLIPTLDQKILNALFKNKILIYQRLAKMDKCIITENPELVWKRQRYLKKIAEYREERRSIIYIGEKETNKVKKEQSKTVYLGEETKSQRLIIAASSRDGLIDSACQLKDNEYVLVQWLKDVILPSVSEQTVFVFEEKLDLDTNATPNINSSKKYMIEWLEKLNVPHDPTWHKADLYTVIKKYNQNYSTESNIIEKILKSKGHDVLWTPFGFPELNYFNRLWSEVTKQYKNQTCSKYIEMIMAIANSYEASDWKLFETALHILEVRIYKEDRQIEHIIDGLMTMARDKVLSQMDLPAECSEYYKEYAQDRFIDNIIID